MLKNDIMEPSNNDWSSPCILVPKTDGTYRLCTDFRKVNSVTKTDSYPIPRIDDCIDKIGSAKFVSKFDLLKGYYSTDYSQQLEILFSLSNSPSFARDFSAFKVSPSRTLRAGETSKASSFQKINLTSWYSLDNVRKPLKHEEKFVDDNFHQYNLLFFL